MLYKENMKHKIKIAFCSLYLKQYCVVLCAQLFPDGVKFIQPAQWD